MAPLAALFAVMIFAIIWMADVDKLPWFIDLFYDLPYGDKLGHFTLFGILNFLVVSAAFASSHLGTRKRIAVKASIILTFLIGAEEASQAFFPARTFSLDDILAGIAGVAAGGWLAYWIEEKKNSTNSS